MASLSVPVRRACPNGQAGTLLSLTASFLNGAAVTVSIVELCGLGNTLRPTHMGGFDVAQPDIASTLLSLTLALVMPSMATQPNIKEAREKRHGELSRTIKRWVWPYAHGASTLLSLTAILFSWGCHHSEHSRTVWVVKYVMSYAHGASTELSLTLLRWGCQWQLSLT
jgi:hypothetical protein